MTAAQDESFGDRLKSFRLQAKLTQKQLGEKVGVRHAAVSSWELGKTEPPLKALPILSDVLNVSLETLLTGREENLPEI